jgi:hypothetical protein
VVLVAGTSIEGIVVVGDGKPAPVRKKKKKKKEQTKKK